MAGNYDRTPPAGNPSGRKIYVDTVKRGVLRRAWELGYSIKTAAHATFTDVSNVRSLFIYWDQGGNE